MTDETYGYYTEGIGYALDIGSDRRADIEAKQSRVGAMIRESGREGLLLLEPENFSWLTAGGTPRGHIDGSTTPVLYCTQEGRWVICSNADSQRLFDEEIDGLGFQLKEWPWHWGRAQLLADLCTGKRLLVDRPSAVPAEGDFLDAGPKMFEARLSLTAYEQACLMSLGRHVAHALEAACRTMNRNDSEREVAGQIAHRLIHRGVQPVHIGVAADGRSEHYRRHGFTSAEVEGFAVLSATARKYGLHATATRMVCFGEPPAELKAACSAVVRVSAAYLASTWPDAGPREILLAGKRIYGMSGYEHDWLLHPQGHLTGRAAVEGVFVPKTTSLLQHGQAVTWVATAGPAVSCDTYIVTDAGPRPVTPAEQWPLKRIRIQGADCIRPDILVRP